MRTKAAPGARIARTMSEKELQKNVIELAHLYRWRVAHFRKAMTKAGHWVTPVAADGKGFPDLLMVGHKIVAVELKSERGRRTFDQEEWNYAFRCAKVDTLLWRPSDWLSGIIREWFEERGFQ